VIIYSDMSLVAEDDCNINAQYTLWSSIYYDWLSSCIYRSVEYLEQTLPVITTS